MNGHVAMYARSQSRVAYVSVAIATVLIWTATVLMHFKIVFR